MTSTLARICRVQNAQQQDPRPVVEEHEVERTPEHIALLFGYFL